MTTWLWLDRNTYDEMNTLIFCTQSQPWNKGSVLLSSAVEAAELGHGIHSGRCCDEVAFQLACIREVGILTTIIIIIIESTPGIP